MINHCRATAHFYCRQAREVTALNLFCHVFRIVFMNTSAGKRDIEAMLFSGDSSKKIFYPFIPIDLKHLSPVSKVIGISTTNEDRL